MSSYKTILTAGLLALTLPQIANAQALKKVKEPANLPPADFKGVQYVDNNGCIFVRTGRLGVVNWVPRIDQSRTHMCSPSYAATFPNAVTPKTGTATEKVPTTVASLDRGNVTFKGDVVQPVTAPDTSLIKPNVASPSAAEKAKKAAELAAKQAEDKKLAEQAKAAEKLRADAIAKQKAKEAAKEAELAKAIEMAKADKAKAAEPKAKVDNSPKIAEANQDRAAAKAARAAAAAAKKAKAAEARVAAAAARRLQAEERKAKAAARKEELAAKKAADKKAKAEKASALPSGHYVDLGLMSASKADKAAKRMLASGYKVQTKSSDKGVEVFVGPFRTSTNARVAFYQATGEGYKKAKIVMK